MQLADAEQVLATPSLAVQAHQNACSVLLQYLLRFLTRRVVYLVVACNGGHYTNEPAKVMNVALQRGFCAGWCCCHMPETVARPFHTALVGHCNVPRRPVDPWACFHLQFIAMCAFLPLVGAAADQQQKREGAKHALPAWCLGTLLRQGSRAVRVSANAIEGFLLSGCHSASPPLNPPHPPTPPGPWLPNDGA